MADREYSMVVSMRCPVHVILLDDTLFPITPWVMDAMRMEARRRVEGAGWVGFAAEVTRVELGPVWCRWPPDPDHIEQATYPIVGIAEVWFRQRRALPEEETP